MNTQSAFCRNRTQLAFDDNYNYYLFIRIWDSAVTPPVSYGNFNVTNFTMEYGAYWQEFCFDCRNVSIIANQGTAGGIDIMRMFTPEECVDIMPNLSDAIKNRGVKFFMYSFWEQLQSDNVIQMEWSGVYPFFYVAAAFVVCVVIVAVIMMLRR